MARTRFPGRLTALETAALWAAAHPDDKAVGRPLRGYSRGVITRARLRAATKLSTWLTANGFVA
jgi:hypothetical protein